eukprot:11202993-Lingulodinium_polyedra.AAC.1
MRGANDSGHPKDPQTWHVPLPLVTGFTEATAGGASQGGMIEARPTAPRDGRTNRRMHVQEHAQALTEPLVL